MNRMAGEGVVEEVGPANPGGDVDVVGHWMASSSVVGDSDRLDCLVDEGQLWVVLSEGLGHSQPGD